MRNNYRHIEPLDIQITIQDKTNNIIKSITISVDDYIDKTIGKKCNNVADDIIANMLKNIAQEKP